MASIVLSVLLGLNVALVLGGEAHPLNYVAIGCCAMALQATVLAA
jgi:hypothetical protein